MPKIAKWKPQNRKWKMSFLGVKKPCHTDCCPMMTMAYCATIIITGLYILKAAQSINRVHSRPAVQR